MPTYEVEKGGKTYEIEAPSVEAMSKAMQSIGLPPGKMPVTGEGQPAMSEIRGLEPGVDYQQGTGLGTSLNLARASNDAEKEMYIKNKFGEGNYRKDAGGRYLVKQGDQWVSADSISGVYPVVSKLATGVPTTGGAAAGAAVGGAFGGPVGAIGGAGVGAAAGKGLDELTKLLQGFSNQTPGSVAAGMGGEAGLAMAGQAVGPALNAAKKPVSNFLSKAGPKIGGVTAETRAVKQSLDPYGVSGPIASLAPKLKTFEYDRNLRNLLMGDPMEAGRIGAIDKRSAEVLAAFGMNPTEIASALPVIKDRMATLSGKETSDLVKKGLETRATALPEARAYKLQAEDFERQAKAIVDKTYTDLRASSNLQRTGSFLAGKVLEDYQGARDSFYKEVGGLYKQIDKMTGDRPIVNLSGAQDAARKFMDTIDPSVVPPIIKRLAGAPAAAPRGPSAAGVPPLNMPAAAPSGNSMVDKFRELLQGQVQGIDAQMGKDAQAASDALKQRAALYTQGQPGNVVSFAEAHELRTSLRAMAAVKDFSPIGQRRGVIAHMAAQIDQALGDAEGLVGKDAARMLKTADKTFSEGVKRFTNAEVNNVLQDARQGRAPDAAVLANMLLDKDSADTVKQVWGVLSPQTQALLKKADEKNMMDAISTFKDGKNTLDPEAMMDWLAERSSVNKTIYDPAELRMYRDWAQDARKVNGTLPVEAGSNTPVTKLMQQARDAQYAAERAAKENPIAALRSQIPEMSDAGARWFIRPGNESATLEGVKALGGENSPEWQQVRKFAIQDLLKSSVRARGKGLGETVSGGAMETGLGAYTPAQQRVIFGKQLDDVRLIAQQARYLFPEINSEAGSSIAAANIQGHLPSSKAIRGYTWSLIAGRLADSPALASALAGKLRADPYGGRSLMGWMLQYGADVAGAGKAPQQMMMPNYETPNEGAKPKNQLFSE